MQWQWQGWGLGTFGLGGTLQKRHFGLHIPKTHEALHIKSKSFQSQRHGFP